MAPMRPGPAGRTGKGSSGNRSPSKLVRAFLVLVGCSFLLLSLVSVPMTAGNTSRTRAVVSYTGSIDGDGSDNDICLAGFREYSVNLTFPDVNLTSVESFELDLEEISTISGNTIHPLLSYDVPNSSLVQITLADDVDVRALTVSQPEPGSMSVNVKLFFFLSWDLETSVKLIPKLRVNGTMVQLDTAHQVAFSIWGDLDVSSPTVTDMDGTLIGNRATLRSGTDITLSGIRLNYIHPTESFTAFSPVPENIEVLVNDSVEDHQATYVSDAFTTDLVLPRVTTDKVTLTIRVGGARSDWLFRVKAWSFEVLLDDLSPTITLKSPGKDIRVDTEEFTYVVQFQDQPSQSPILVNGSSLEYRVMKGSVWSDWKQISPLADEKGLSYTGTAVGQRGAGNTSLQFRARDGLGNLNISAIFPIHINVPPTLTVPDEYKDSVWLSNTSLTLDGSKFAFDPDNDELGYEWYIEDIDINPLSSSRNFNRSLFNIDEGKHTIKLVVSDGGSESEVSFNITVKKVEDQEDGKTIIDILFEEGGIYFLIPLALLIAIIIVVPVIIIVHRRTREETDFVVDENNVLSSTQADEMARKLRELYEGSQGNGFDGNTAEMDLSTEFDFDYNLYEILGLDRTATPQEIKKKYRDQAAFFHPDRVTHHKEINLSSAIEEMIKINKAKEILLNPETRAKYDASIADMDFSIDINDVGDEVEEPGEDWS